MKIAQIVETLRADVLAGRDSLDEEILMACGADLMSDVLAFSKEHALMLTGLVNPQVVRTAQMMDVKAIAFVRGKVPTAEIIELAGETGVVIMSTQYPMYGACGRLFSAGLAGVDPFSDKA